MAIKHLLNNTMTLWKEVESLDAYGGQGLSYSTLGTFSCRIEKLSQDRLVTGGRENTDATHRIYCDNSAAINAALDYDVRIQINGNSAANYRIVGWEDLDPILSASKIKHIEILVEYFEATADFLPAYTGTAVFSLAGDDSEGQTDYLGTYGDIGTTNDGQRTFLNENFKYIWYSSSAGRWIISDTIGTLGAGYWQLSVLGSSEVLITSFDFNGQGTANGDLTASSV